MLRWSLALLWVCLQRILQTFEIFNYKKLIFHPLLLPVLFNVQVMNKWHTDMCSFLPLVKSSKELSVHKIKMLEWFINILHVQYLENGHSTPFHF